MRDESGSGPGGRPSASGSCSLSEMNPEDDPVGPVRYRIRLASAALSPKSRRAQDAEPDPRPAHSQGCATTLTKPSDSLGILLYLPTLNRPRSTFPRCVRGSSSMNTSSRGTL